jgi:hypothetical protein
MNPLVGPYSLDWVNKLGSKDKYPDKEQASTIHNLRRDDIFYHKYTVENIFYHIYKGPSEKAKRQPNPFMIFRAVLGLVAHNKNVKLGDGTLQSKLAGFIWAGASQQEKKRFENLASEFKTFHKTKFPKYEYKPKARSTAIAFINVNTKTPNDYKGFDVSNFNEQKSLENYLSQESLKSIHPQDAQPEIYYPQPPNDLSYSTVLFNGSFGGFTPFIYPQTSPLEEFQTTLLDQELILQGCSFQQQQQPIQGVTEGYPFKQQSIPDLYQESDDMFKRNNYLGETSISANCYPNQNQQNLNLQDEFTSYDDDTLQHYTNFTF